MKAPNTVAIALLVVGGLNWGLVGTTGFDLVRAIFGEMTPLSRIVYSLVGVAAVFQLATWRSTKWRPAVRPVNVNR